MNNKDFNIYVIAEIQYKKVNENKENIFPRDWYTFKDYKIKTEIIAEAIKNKQLIKDTIMYQKYFNNDCVIDDFMEKENE